MPIWWGLSLLLLIAVIDFRQRRVPNLVVLPATALALGHAWTVGRLPAAAAGAVVAFLTFLALYAAGQRLYGAGALGMGDVKLAALIGALAGVERAPVVLLLGILLAGAAAAGLLLTGRARPGDTLPYGSFLALAAAMALLAGQ
jgi:leader peptidase (prepilin peptidase)/N-methyltransferase